MVIGCLLMLFKASYSQRTLDSVIRKFLVDKNQIDKAIHTRIKTKEGGFLEKANYFLEKKPVIHLSDTITVQPVIFGCYKSHASKFLLIEYKIRSKSLFYVFGEERLLQEIDKLRKELLESEEISWNDDDVAALVNYLSLCYL